MNELICHHAAKVWRLEGVQKVFFLRSEFFATMSERSATSPQASECSCTSNHCTKPDSGSWLDSREWCHAAAVDRQALVTQRTCWHLGRDYAGSWRCNRQWQWGWGNWRRILVTMMVTRVALKVTVTSLVKWWGESSRQLSLQTSLTSSAVTCARKTKITQTVNHALDWTVLTTISSRRENEIWLCKTSPTCRQNSAKMESHKWQTGTRQFRYCFSTTERTRWSCSTRLTHIYNHTNIVVFTNSVYTATTTTSYVMLTTKRQTDRLTMAVKCYMHTRGWRSTSWRSM